MATQIQFDDPNVPGGPAARLRNANSAAGLRNATAADFFVDLTEHADRSCPHDPAI